MLKARKGHKGRKVYVASAQLYCDDFACLRPLEAKHCQSHVLGGPHIQEFTSYSVFLTPLNRRRVVQFGTGRSAPALRHFFTFPIQTAETIPADRSTICEQTEDRAEVVKMVSFMQRLEQAKAEVAQRNADPLGGRLAAVVRGLDAISTVALLDLIGLPRTSGNARRISRTMQSLGFVPIKSRRFMPGGYRDTVTRGWTRPVRELKKRYSPDELNTAAMSAANDGG